MPKPKHVRKRPKWLWWAWLFFAVGIVVHAGLMLRIEHRSDELHSLIIELEQEDEARGQASVSRALEHIEVLLQRYCGP